MSKLNGAVDALIRSQTRELRLPTVGSRYGDLADQAAGEGTPHELGYVQARRQGLSSSSRSSPIRNEVASILVTTNLPFGEWTCIFTDAGLCKAIVDRLTFGTHIIETDTDFWRLRRSLDRAR